MHGRMNVKYIISAESTSRPPWSPDLILLDLSMPPTPKGIGALRSGLDASQ